MVAENHELLITVEFPSEKQHSVFKLPPEITSLRNNAFQPIFISFGPYHYNTPLVKPMEDLKRIYLDRFLEITHTKLQDVLQSFKPMEQQLMDHYDQLGNEWRHGDCFLELMIRDGCFMLDILQDEYSTNKPVIDMFLITIKRDMLLIENQLPLLVLDKLIADHMVVFEKLMHGNNEILKRVKKSGIKEEELRNTIHEKIHELISEFFGFPMEIKSHNVLCPHALEVVRENMIKRQGPIQRPVLTTAFGGRSLEPATTLRHTGIKFEVRNTPSIMDITFDDKNMVLSIPQIVIDEETDGTFLNLMAFERFQTGKTKEVSAYIDFMVSLIRSADDVSLLRSMRIIKSSIESDWDIAWIFRELDNNLIIEPDDSLDDVRWNLQCHYQEKVQGNEYKEKRVGWASKFKNETLAQWASDFKQTYCKNPCTFIGLLAGILLLMLAVMQTFYTVLSYYNKN